MMTISTRDMHPAECGGREWPDTMPSDFSAPWPIDIGAGRLGHAEELQAERDTTCDGGMIGRLLIYVCGLIAIVGAISWVAGWRP